MKTTRTNRGSSFIELLLAASVVAIALVAAAATVLQSSDLERANEQTRAAGPILASLLDEVRATPFANVQATWSGTTRAVPGLPGCSTPAQATWTVADVPGSDARWVVRSVRVTLRWNGLHGPQEAAAITYLSDRTIGAPPPGEIVPVDPETP